MEHYKLTIIIKEKQMVFFDYCLGVIQHFTVFYYSSPTLDDGDIFIAR